MFLLPLIAGAHAYSAHFWSQLRLHSIPESYEVLLTPTLFPVLIILVLGFTYYGLHGPIFASAEAPTNSLTPPAHEVVAALCLLAMPFLVAVLALTATHAFVATYAITMVIGIAILLGFAASQPRPGVELFALLGAGLLVSFFAAKQISYDLAFALNPLHAWGSPYRSPKVTPARWRDLALPPIAATHGLPIAVADNSLFTQLQFYAPQQLRSRLVYPTSRAASIQYQGYDTDEILWQALRRSTGSNVQEYRLFVEANPRFFVVGSFGVGWLLPQLLADHARLELVGVVAEQPLFLVTRK